MRTALIDRLLAKVGAITAILIRPADGRDQDALRLRAGDASKLAASQAIAQVTSSSLYWATVGPRGLTRIEMPPASLIASKPFSSAVSSPRKTGRRPAKGEIAMKRRTAAPLAASSGMSSTPAFPGMTR